MKLTQKYRGSIAVGSVLALAALGMTACSSSEPASTDAAGGGTEACEVHTLLVATVTGPAGENGVGEVKGAESAVRTINEDGGVNGCTLVLDVVDDAGDVTQTLSLAQAAMQTKDYAHVNVTGYGAYSLVPYLIQEDQFALTSFGPANGTYDPKVAKSQFDVVNIISDSGAVVIDYAVKQGAKKIGIVTDDTAVGGGVADIVTEVITSEGAEVATVERVPLATVDFTPVIQRLRAAGADAVFVDLYGEVYASSLRDIKASGWDVPVYAGQIAYVTNIGQLLPPEDFAGVISGGVSGISAPSSDGTQALIDDLIANGDDNLAAHLSAAIWGHDSITLFAWAANETGSVEAADLAGFLQENTTTAVPNLAGAVNTGYSATNHDWKGTDSIALVNVTALDEQGRYPDRIGLFTPPGGPE